MSVQGISRPAGAGGAEACSIIRDISGDGSADGYARGCCAIGADSSGKIRVTGVVGSTSGSVAGPAETAILWSAKLGTGTKTRSAGLTSTSAGIARAASSNPFQAQSFARTFL